MSTEWKVGDKAWIRTDNNSGAFHWEQRNGNVVLEVTLLSPLNIWGDPGFIIRHPGDPNDQTIRSRYLYRTLEEAVIGAP